MQAAVTDHIDEFDNIEEEFQAFHAAFAPAFGRKQWIQRGLDYLRGLLTHTGERSNAENLSEMVDASPRVLQRFLTEARWNDTMVMEQLQKVAQPLLAHSEAVWAVDESGVVKQGKKSAGVGRQYCGSVGKVANCQMGVYLSNVSPTGRLLVDKRLYLPQAWIDDPERCRDAGIPSEEQSYRSKSELALCMLTQAVQWGHLHAEYVTGDDAYGQSPGFRDGVDALGLLFVLDMPENTPVWPLEVHYETAGRKARGRQPRPHPAPGQRKTLKERAGALPWSAWQILHVAEGAQGPRRYQFAWERMRESRDNEPGKEVWVIYRKALDESEPRYYFSNAPLGTPLQKLAEVSASRWPIETEFEDSKSLIGLGEYEVRSWHGWHHHIACCMLANAFLLRLQQKAKKKGGDMVGITRPLVYRVVRELLPKKHWSKKELDDLLAYTLRRNEAAKRSHAKRREQEAPDILQLVRSPT